MGNDVFAIRREVALLEEGVWVAGGWVPVADRGDLAIRQLEDGDLAFFLGEIGDQRGVVAEDDAVGVFAHLGKREHAADAGHAVDVGDVVGIAVGEVGGAKSGEHAVGGFAGIHVMRNKQEASFGRLEGESLAMLVFGAEGSDFRALGVGVGLSGEGRQCQGEEDGYEFHDDFSWESGSEANAASPQLLERI